MLEIHKNITITKFYDSIIGYKNYCDNNNGKFESENVGNEISNFFKNIRENYAVETEVINQMEEFFRITILSKI